MPLPEDYKKLIPRLIKHTKQKRLQWSAAEDSEYAFVVSFHKFLVKVADVGVPDGTEFELSLLSQEGPEIDSHTISAGEEDFDDVAALWTAARRRAFRVDDALREIGDKLEHLDAADESPFE